MKHIKVLLLGALVVLLFTTGCNLFGFANPSGSSTSNLADGQRKYWDGDFDGAVADFAKAIENDSENAEAYWWHAKALLRATGNTAISLITALSDIDAQSTSILPLPFMDSVEWPNEDANSLYQAMFGIKYDLAMIYDGNVYSDELDQDAVGLDFASTLSIFSALMLRDTNVDSVINDDDVNFGDLAYFLNGEFYIDEDLWEQLTEEDMIELIIAIDENIDILIDIIADLLEEMDIEGIDLDELDDNMDLIRDELWSMHPDSTGGN